MKFWAVAVAVFTAGLLALCVYAAVRYQAREQKCEAAGGTLMKTNGGTECFKVERIDVK